MNISPLNLLILVCPRHLTLQRDPQLAMARVEGGKELPCILRVTEAPIFQVREAACWRVQIRSQRHASDVVKWPNRDRPQGGGNQQG